VKRIILTNQHLDNRGDESATIGAINSLRHFFGPDTEISIYLQSGTKYKFLPDYCHVKEKAMIVSLSKIIEMLIWIILKSVGIDIRKICSKNLQEFIIDHETADIVISSCGGPYIGDIYIDHEIVHILHMVLPILLEKNTAFFASSMGPFNNRLMNIFRKAMLRKIGVIVLRDAISYDFVKKFLPENVNVHLTTDACIADHLDLTTIIKKTDTIGITPLEYKYPLSANPTEKQANYEKSIVSALDKLMDENEKLQVEFFPQLYAKYSDVPFIKKIIGDLKFPNRAYIFSDQKSGREQQLEIASLNYMIATRYHSAIFACKTGTPVECIVYEHKARAFMDTIGLGEYCLDIYHISQEEILRKIDLLNKNYMGINSILLTNMKKLESLAFKTAEMVFQSASN